MKTLNALNLSNSYKLVQKNVLTVGFEVGEGSIGSIVVGVVVDMCLFVGSLIILSRIVDCGRHMDPSPFHRRNEPRCWESHLSIVATVKRLKLHFQTVTPDHKRISHSVSVSIFSGYYS